jgi:hypothetical protein
MSGKLAGRLVYLRKLEKRSCIYGEAVRNKRSDLERVGDVALEN